MKTDITGRRNLKMTAAKLKLPIFLLTTRSNRNSTAKSIPGNEENNDAIAEILHELFFLLKTHIHFA